MNPNSSRLTLIVFVTLATALALFSGQALADKPEWAGGGKSKSAKKQAESGNAAFGSRERQIVADYYGSQARQGKCPPGLAKKNNGCLPPGQAKKWQRGAPLPQDLRYYDLPGELLRRLPPPPVNHRYVQIAGDILMIAIGTRMVVDAIEDILR